MKKTVAILYFLLSILFNAVAQQVYKFEYKPNRVYIQSTLQKIHSEIKYEGTKEQMKKLEEKEIKNPEISEDIQKIDIQTTIGKLKKDSSFILSIEFLKTADKNENELVPAGSKMFGYCILKKSPIIDSVFVNGVIKLEKKSMKQIFETTVLHIPFPEKKITVGDVFYSTIPLNFPLEENKTAYITIGTAYKLKEIKNGIAIFEINQLYKMNLGKAKYPYKINGRGSGILFYNLKENFYHKYELNSELIYKIEYDNFTVEATTTTNYIQKASVTSK
jgi:hypothetical protein